MKYINIPFAQDGAVSVIPDSSEDGSVNNKDGYTADYEKDKRTDGAAKSIERSKLNYLLNLITQEIKNYQTNGVPDYVSAVMNDGIPVAYPLSALVRFDAGSGTKIYISLKDDNVDSPANKLSWELFGVGQVLPGLSVNIAGDTLIFDSALNEAGGGLSYIQLQTGTSQARLKQYNDNLIIQAGGTTKDTFYDVAAFTKDHISSKVEIYPDADKKVSIGKASHVWKYGHISIVKNGDTEISLLDGSVDVNQSLAVEGTVTPSDYTNFDARYSQGSQSVTHLVSGEIFNPLAAPAGIYILGDGVTITNAPQGPVVQMYTARVEILEAENAITLTTICATNDSHVPIAMLVWGYSPFTACWHETTSFSGMHQPLSSYVINPAPVG
ncbi:hypothetical protein [Rahnella aceris]|uniref:hypothetical protein n=1 Tax=Rahnella sp. (strain Y9602) TaxID=2703885 RepID=UPI001C25F241|nr:hypothetical protein [Rahnella aceris]MBU9866828.1 hypothetical protein [Rahnella aceris]